MNNEQYNSEAETKFKENAIHFLIEMNASFLESALEEKISSFWRYYQEKKIEIELERRGFSVGKKEEERNICDFYNQDFTFVLPVTYLTVKLNFNVETTTVETKITKDSMICSTSLRPIENWIFFDFSMLHEMKKRLILYIREDVYRLMKQCSSFKISFD